MAKNANGNGSIRKKTVTRDGKEYEYWEARYSAGADPVTGKPRQKSITGKSQKEVSAKLKQALAALDNGTYCVPCKMTLREWSQKWLSDYAGKELKESSLVLYEQRIRLHILPTLGNHKIGELTAPTIQTWVNSLTDDNGKLSPKTAAHTLVVLHAMLRRAYLLDLIPRNVCDKVMPPRIEHKVFTPCSDEDLANLFAELAEHDDEYAPLIRFALLTGVREGELCGLAWDAVDLRAGTVTIRQQLARKDTSLNYHISTPKSGKPRTLTLAPMAVDLLHAVLKRQQKNAVMLGALYDNPWNLVFTRADGNYFKPEGLSSHFKVVAKRIGRPELRFHDLRHTYATLCLQNGDSVKAVQTALGHSTASITLDLYAHVTDRMARESADKLQAYLEKIG